MTDLVSFLDYASQVEARGPAECPYCFPDDPCVLHRPKDDGGDEEV